MYPTKIITENAPIVLDEIKKSSSILMHFHPSPDPDSVGSVLAMKEFLESLGKKVTVISGDSLFPESFAHFHGADSIVTKKFSEVDLPQFDLFLILDTASPEQVSRYSKVIFPLSVRTVIIDHHKSNTGFADVNLVEPTYPATAQILYELFEIWGFPITPSVAQNLFMGIYTDTLFKYELTNFRTFEIAADLVKIAPDFSRVVRQMENSRSFDEVAFLGLALDSVKVFVEGKVGISVIPYDSIVAKNIHPSQVHAGMVSPQLNTVRDWMISAIMVEVQPKQVKMSFRTKDADKYDVSRIASAFGGGGHKSASGAAYNLSEDETIDDAVLKVVSEIKKMYNF